MYNKSTVPFVQVGFIKNLTCYRLEVQADVTSTQRFSLCSETASAATSLSEKSVNASIALDDGAASTRALAGSVLNFKVFFLLNIVL